MLFTVIYQSNPIFCAVNVNWCATCCRLLLAIALKIFRAHNFTYRTADSFSQLLCDNIEIGSFRLTATAGCPRSDADVHSPNFKIGMNPSLMWSRYQRQFLVISRFHLFSISSCYHGRTAIGNGIVSITNAQKPPSAERNTPHISGSV